MRIEIDAESVKELVNPELSVTLGEPAWSKYNKDGTPAKDAVPVYDDPRLTLEDKALIEAVVENPTKAKNLKDSETVKEVYKTEVESKVAESKTKEESLTPLADTV